MQHHEGFGNHNSQKQMDLAALFSFLIEHPKGMILFDTGWHREMSPEGVFDKRAQIKSLGSYLLYQINQGRIATGEAINEHLERMGIKPSELDYVLISHLDCDHANGLKQVADAKHILVSRAEMEGTTRKNFQIRIRFQRRWWEGVDLQTFDWNGSEGPVGKSYDVLGDGSLVMVNIPDCIESLATHDTDVEPHVIEL